MKNKFAFDLHNSSTLKTNSGDCWIVFAKKTRTCTVNITNQSLLLMTWWCTDLGHQQTWYWPSLRGIFFCLHQCMQRVINSQAPGRFEYNFRQSIFKLILVIDGWWISWEIALRCTGMSLDLTNDKSTSVQIMVWCPGLAVGMNFF